MQEEIYIVKLQRPAGVSVKDMENYIRNALDNWRGELSPEDPMFDFDYGKLTVLQGELNVIQRP